VIVKVLAIAATTLRRTFRRRTNLIFIFVVPMLLILVIGLANGGGSGTLPVGVVSAGSGTLGQDLASRFEKVSSLEVVPVSDSTSLQTEVERGDLAGGVVIPSGFDSMVRTGQQVTIAYFARPDRSGQQLGQTLRSVVAQQSEVIGAARFAVAQGAAPNFDSAFRTATEVSARAPSVSVVETMAGTPSPFRSVTAYDMGAWTELLLFVFLLALTWGAVGFIETRRLGIAQRMLSTPTTARTVIAGTVLGRVSVGTVQAVIIIAGSALLFGVRWGDPIGVATVVILFALVSTGAGLLLGTIFRNEQQTGGVALLLGLGLAALGGCMAPLELYSPVMRQIAHLTPHAWANDAFAQLVGHGATVLQILPQLGVLAAFAAVLLTLATWRLRRVLIA
jgi:ABC-2 type transport system permease protein